MKKVLLFLSSSILLVSVLGCSLIAHELSKSSTTSSSSSSSSSAQTSTPIITTVHGT